MTPSGSFLVRIFSPACFQGKSSRDVSSFLGPNSLLGWCALMSTLNMTFKYNKVLHTLKIFISQKPHKVETLHFRQ